MAPITPHWQQPSHPDSLELVVNAAEYSSKSLSKVTLAPFAVFAKLAFPPCTSAPEPTYATVQTGRDSHLDLNSDLLYINHSCEPSLIFDTGNMNVLAGPKGLKPGDELTFFYPSTEWKMAQPFQCQCNTPSCRGIIGGASQLPAAQLEGVWLNNHIRELLDEQRSGTAAPENGTAAAAATNNDDPTAQALKDALAHAEKVVEAARLALQTYVVGSNGNGIHHIAQNGKLRALNGLEHRGPTSRELSGEMSGDTVRV